MIKNSLRDLLIGIFLVICSIFTFIRPITTFIVLAYIGGIVAIAKGVHLCYVYFKQREFKKVKSSVGLVIGVLLIILGIVFITKPMFVNRIFAYILAIWFIYDALKNYTSVSQFKKVDTQLFVVGLILNLLLLFGGFIIIFNYWIEFAGYETLVAISLLISGIIYAIFSFTGRKEGYKKDRNLK